MKNLLTFVLLFVLLCPVQAQNANSFSSVVPYSGSFSYGMNPGYYGTQFTNPQLGQLAANAGAKSFRINMPDYYVGPYGGNFFAGDLAGYATDGLTNNVGFLGSVWPNNQLDSTFSGCSQVSKIWRGTYLPVWTDSTNGIIDTANTWANYVYKLVSGAGASIKFWELINEMDFTGNTADAGGNSFNVTLNKQSATSWWNVPPPANELVNLQAPVFYYIHMMRVAYGIIKRVQPNAYVAIGGIGYPATLDALMRYTDNPVNGSVTPQFPLTGGAYFDVVNFHTYPMYNLTSWNNSLNAFNYYRYSDRMIDVDTMYVHQYDSVQVAHGYNNITYPKKIYISTETDAPQDSLCDGQWGSLASAINYTIKWNVASQAYGLKQLDKYALGSMPLSNTSSEFNHCGLYGDITPSTTTVANAPQTQEFYGYKTMSTLLYGKQYDAVKTAALNLPSTVRGYAFNDGAGNYTYVMWAKTSIDLSEGANASYTFPFAFSGKRMEWNYSSTNTTTAATQTVALTGNPSFFVATIAPIANAGPDQSITLPVNTATLTGSATDAGGTITSYQWTEISGPSTITITKSTSAVASVAGLIAGKYNFTLTVTDNNGSTGKDTVQITVNTSSGSTSINPPAISSATTASGTVGSAFSYAIAASNTPTSYTATGLPAGLSVSASTGVISGTPTAAATSTVTLSAINAGGTGTKTLTITIIPAAPVISSAATASGKVGTAFTYTITASNTPTSYTATGLPAGLSVSASTGVISGTPTAAATSTVTLSAINAGGTGTKTLTITIIPVAPVISSAATASGKVGTAFTYTITASNTPTSYTATGLPAGLSVSASTGVISGTPSAAATSTVTLSAINAGGTGTKTLTITISPAAPVISSAATASGTIGTAFSYTITASNTPTSYTATGLPTGLSVNATTGVISGTPTAAATSTVTLNAINAGGTGTKTLTITISPAAPVISSAATASGKVGTAFSYTITASNTPTSYTATGLPAGLSVSASTGVISGTPSAAATSTVTLSAINAGGTGTKTLTITISPAAPVISSAATASGTVGTAFSYTITASNTPTSYTATGLPAGLSVNATTGVISGTPSAAATSTVTLSAINAGGTGTKTLTVTISAAIVAPVISSAATASGTVGTAFSYTIAASNTPTSYTATSLPAGLSVNATTGVISGTPSAAATSTVTMSAINAGGTGTKTLTVTISAAIVAPVISSAATASGTVGTAFSYTIAASNTPTSYTATSLPAGLSVNATTGVISGTPSAAATSTVTMSAINAGGTGTKTLTITISATVVAPVISSATTASGKVGTAFSYSITASNTPTSYTATGLPTGLSVNTSTGVISGTPTAAATSTVTLSAINAGGTGTKTLTITISAAIVAPVISSAATASGTVGTVFSYTIAASNTPTSYTATGLPAGLSVSASTGIISGTPTAAATSTVTLSAINAAGTGTKTLVITISAVSTNKAPVANAGGHNLLSWALTSSNTVVSSVPVNGGLMLPGTNFPNPGAFNTDGYKAVIASGNWPTTATNGTNIDFPVLPTAGVDLTITGITFTAKTSGSSGSNIFSLAYQQDGAGAWIPFGTPQTALSGATTNINFGALNQLLINGHTYVVRLYIYAASTTTSSRNVYVKNVILTGTSALDITLPTNSTTLNGSGNDSDGTIASYLWTKVSGPSAGTITSPSSAVTTLTNLAAGVYKFVLTVTDNLGAKGTDTIQVTVNVVGSREATSSNTTGNANTINDIVLNATIYPNPVQSTLNTSITSPTPDQELLIMLTDISGRTIYRTNAVPTGTTTTLQIDVSHFINGVYFLTIQAGSNRITRKVIKE